MDTHVHGHLALALSMPYQYTPISQQGPSCTYSKKKSIAIIIIWILPGLAIVQCEMTVFKEIDVDKADHCILWIAIDSVAAASMFHSDNRVVPQKYHPYLRPSCYKTVNQ